MLHVNEGWEAQPFSLFSKALDEMIEHFRYSFPNTFPIPFIEISKSFNEGWYKERIKNTKFLSKIST